MDPVGKILGDNNSKDRLVPKKQMDEWYKTPHGKWCKTHCYNCSKKSTAGWCEKCARQEFGDAMVDKQIKRYGSWELKEKK